MKRSALHFRNLSSFIILIVSTIGLITACGGQPTVADPPVVSDPKISAPTPQEPGQEIGISVDVSSASGAALSYDWRADGGEIVRGQGSPAITYRTPEEPGIYNVRVAVKWDNSSIEKITTIRVEPPGVTVASELPTETAEPVFEEESPTATPRSPTATRQPTYTPQPSDTPTPKPTNTPRPTPVPTATIDADPAVYDNFNNSAFDEGWNRGVWSIDFQGNSGTARVVQQNGMLMISDTENSVSDGFILKLDNWKKPRFKFFEIMVMLSSEKQGNSGNISINAESSDIPGGWTELGIGHSDSVVIARARMNNEWITGPEFQYDTWHKLRIEFDNQTNVFTYLVDDQAIGTFSLSISGEVGFKPVIQLWHKKGTSVNAFIEEVRIG